MDLAGKIYESKENWNLSFEALAFVLEMDKTMVIKLYRQELKRRKAKQPLSLDSDTKLLVNSLISVRTYNLLKRASSLEEVEYDTIRNFLSLDAKRLPHLIKHCGHKTISEVSSAQMQLRAVLDGGEPVC